MIFTVSVLTRFRHSLAILRESFSEGLVDHATLLIWLSNQVAICNLAQLGFVVKVVDEYIECLVDNRGFLKPLMEGCLTKLMEVSGEFTLSDSIPHHSPRSRLAP
jgi:mediator of RNA polymerase II transcription subunit 12, fungi type